MKTPKRKVLTVASLAALPTILLWTGNASAQLTTGEPDYYLKLLGKNIFFDAISKPEDAQGCSSCHDPSKGWILPNSRINATTVSAPGARLRRRGSIKTPANAYASFSPVFQLQGENPFAPPWEGGNFWDGRAEGCGALGSTSCPRAGATSQTINASDLPPLYASRYAIYLGPTADQALNPFPNAVEQNIRIDRVCKTVLRARYSSLYQRAYGVPIDCTGVDDLVAAPTSPVSLSYKRFAVALAAWQASKDVNSFTSRRDRALNISRQFPNRFLTAAENLGHDLFYGRNDSGLNNGGINGSPKNANCTICHSGIPGNMGLDGDPLGVDPRQLYTDNRYHNIGTPYNREVIQSNVDANGNVTRGTETVAFGAKRGLIEHIGDDGLGEFKAPTLRNVGKGANKYYFIKAYAHNGWFKSLKSIVHFYNTSQSRTRCEQLVPTPIVNATEREALAADCWPQPEFTNGLPPPVLIGALGLTDTEENAIVAYLNALTDDYTPTRPR